MQVIVIDMTLDERILLQCEKFAGKHVAQDDISQRFGSELSAEKPAEESVVVFKPCSFDKVKRAYSTWGDGCSFYVVIGQRLFAVTDVGLEAGIRLLASESNWTDLKDLNSFVSLLDRYEKRTCLRSRPTSIQLETTEVCNAECIMCNHLYSGKAPRNTKALEVFNRVERIFPFLRMAMIHGNGEPFLEKGLEQRIRTLSSFGIALTTNTNLSVLPKRILEVIPSAFFEIRISCDSCDSDCYEAIRRGLSFRRFSENLAVLNQKAPQVRKVLVAVLMRQNICQVQDLVRFAAENGFFEISFQELGVNAVIGNQNDSPVLFPHLAAHHFRLAKGEAKKLGIQLSYPGFIDLKLHDDSKMRDELKKLNAAPLFPDDGQVRAIRERARIVGNDDLRPIENLETCSWQESVHGCTGICEWCIERPYIDNAGNVFPCCINATYAVGNLFDYDSFEELWNNEVYQQIRRSFYEGRLPVFCEGCQFLSTGKMNYVSVTGFDAGDWKKHHVSALYKQKRELIDNA